jgi:predicted RND superfamily exporter protein
MFGLRQRYLLRLADAVCHHPGWFMSAALMLAVVSAVYAAHGLEFKTSRNDLIGRDGEFWRLHDASIREFRSEEDYVVQVRGSNPSRNREAVDKLRAALLAGENNPHPVDAGYAQQFVPTDVFARVNYEAIEPWYLYYLPLDDLRRIRDSIGEFRQLVAVLASDPSLVSFFGAMDQMLRQMEGATLADRGRMASFLPTVEAVADHVRTANALDDRHGLLSPWATAFFSAHMIREAELQMQWNGYHVFEQGRVFVMLIHPRERTAGSGEPSHPETIAKIRRIIGEVQPGFADVSIRLTGESVMDHDEMVAARQDARRAMRLTLLLCGLLFAMAFREWLRPALAIVCVAMVVAVSLGCATIWPGHLNIVTLTFAVLIIGLGIDLMIQFIARYEENVSRGLARVQALRMTFAQTGPTIVTAGTTNAAAFFAMTLSGFRGTIELGVMAGMGMVVATALTLLVLPALLVLVHRRREATYIPARTVATHFERWLLRRPYLVLTSCALGTTVSCLFFWQVRFDHNVLNLQARGLESVDTELQLLASEAPSTIYASVVASDLDQARSLHDRLQQLPSVGNVASVAPLIPTDQDAKRAVVGAIKMTATSVRVAVPDAAAVDADGLRRTLNVVQTRAHALAAKFEADGDGASASALRSLASHLEETRVALGAMDPATAGARLGVYQRRFFVALQDQLEMMARQETDRALAIDTLPDEIRRMLLGRTGKLLLRVFPSENVWERPALERFVAEVKSVDPKAFGAPLGLHEFVAMLRVGYRNAAWWAVTAVALLALVHFKSMRATLIALLPVGAGAVWMMAIMVLPRVVAKRLAQLGLERAAVAVASCEIPFNPANIMAIPLIVGIGVAYGIYVVQRFREDREPVFYGKSTGRAVILSGLTTLVAFGTLAGGTHLGIRSLGIVMCIGVVCCLVASLVLLPALFEVARRHNWDV